MGGKKKKVWKLAATSAFDFIYYFFSLSHVCAFLRDGRTCAPALGAALRNKLLPKFLLFVAEKRGKKICFRGTLRPSPFHCGWVYQQMNLLLTSSVLCVNGSRGFFCFIKKQTKKQKKKKKPSKPFPTPRLVKRWGYEFSAPVVVRWEAANPVRAGKAHR